MILQIIGAYIAVVASSILLEAPSRYKYYNGIIGAVGWGVYLAVRTQWGLAVSIYIAGLVISLMANIYARVFKAPLTVFFIPGFFPLVPGSAMYLTVYELLQGHTEASAASFLDAIKIATMIALSSFTIDTVFKVARKRKQMRK